MEETPERLHCKKAKIKTSDYRNAKKMITTGDAGQQGGAARGTGATQGLMSQETTAGAGVCTANDTDELPPFVSSCWTTGFGGDVAGRPSFAATTAHTSGPLLPQSIPNAKRRMAPTVPDTGNATLS